MLNFSEISRLLLLFTFVAHGKLQAQSAQLPLDQGRYTGITSILEAGKDSFIYSASVLPPSIFGGGKTNNLTQVSLSKGAVWSFDFKYPKTSISCQLTNYKDDFLWSGFISDVNRNKSLMRLDKKGNVIWSKRYGGLNDVDTINGGKSQAIVLPDGNIALGGGAASFGSTTQANDLFLAKLDPNGNQIWAKNYLFSNLSNTYTNFSSVINTNDGGFLICGSIYTSSDRSILLLKTDASGAVQWTRSYSNDGKSFLNDESGVQVVQTANNNFLLIANQRDFNENSGQIIAQINANGTVANTFIVRVNPTLNYTLQANKGIYDASKNALIIGAGVVQDSTPNLSLEQNLLYKISLDGTFDWKYNYYYEILEGFVTSNSDLIQTKNGGFAHLTSFSKSFEELYPILILSDNKGETGCQKPINLVVDKNVTLETESFTIQEKNTASAIDYVVVKTPFNFSTKLPTINLGNDITTCKTDTNFVLNALNADFDTYKWSTGEKTPSITVNQTGQYAVSVTSNKFCLTLNDTLVIKKSPMCDSMTVSSSDSKLFLPTIFTPNDDGINDFFEPLGTGFIVESFQIFDRWGSMVFESSESNKAWNGQFRGRDAMSAVYVYFLKYKQQGKVKILKGEITLIR